MIELGGNINLVGFRNREPAELVVVKKLVGTYARKACDLTPAFKNLTVTMKPVHKRGDSEKFEIHSKIVFGNKTQVNEITDHNLFVALDTSLKKLTSLIK